MRTIIVCVAALLTAALPGKAAAWASANRFGGTTSHTQGSTTRTTGWGSSETHIHLSLTEIAGEMPSWGDSIV